MSQEDRLKNGVSRRKILKSVGAAGTIGSLGIVGSADAKSENEIKRSIQNLEGQQKNKYTSKAKADSEVKKLSNKMENDNWESKESNSIVIQVNNPHKDSEIKHKQYHMVIIPYEKEASHEEARLIWIDKSLESVGVKSPIIHKIRKSAKNIQVESSREALDDAKMQVTTYVIENGNVVTQSKTIESESRLPKNDEIITNACYCETTVLECENIGIWCWVALAGSYAGTYWTCAACLSVVGWIACGKCAAVAISGGAGTISCMENQDCWEETRCRSYDEVNRKPCRICDNIHHPTC